MRAVVLILLVFALGLSPAQGAEQTITLGGMNVTVWAQETADSVGRPVIIFSHGFHGCATQSRFLMEAFASSGYLVFAPDHHDAACKRGISSWFQKPAVPFRQPLNWNETTYRDRAEDIRRLIDAIRADDRFRTRADWSRLGLAGHSLGGYTVLGLGGGWSSWKLSGVKAVLALSPYSQPFIEQRTLSGLSVPVMYQGGTLDTGVTPSVRKSEGSYDQSPEPKYFVEFDQAGHLAWADIGRKTARASIVSYSLAFMNHYVKGEPGEPVLTQALPGVSLLRYESELGTNGAGEPYTPPLPIVSPTRTIHSGGPRN